MKKWLNLLMIMIGTSVHAQVIKSEINLNDSVKLTAEIEVFNRAKHVWDTCHKESANPSICLIDGKIWFGGIAPLALPKSQLKSLSIKIKNKLISLDVSAMYDPGYGNNLRLSQFLLMHTPTGHVLHGVFSDGKGRYIAKWKIMKGRSIREKLTTDSWDFYWVPPMPATR